MRPDRLGAVAQLDLVWTFADMMNGLMALPNLVGLLLLTPVVVAETRKYFDDREPVAIPVPVPIPVPVEEDRNS